MTNLMAELKGILAPVMVFGIVVDEIFSAFTSLVENDWAFFRATYPNGGVRLFSQGNRTFAALDRTAWMSWVGLPPILRNNSDFGNEGCVFIVFLRVRNCYGKLVFLVLSFLRIGFAPARSTSKDE